MPASHRDILKQLNRLYLLHRIYLQRAAAHNQIYFSQLPLMEFVVSHPGCVQKEIAAFLEVTPPTIAAMSKRLEESGLITRTPDTEDRRCNHLFITEKGQAYVDSCHQAFQGIDELVFKGLQEEECEALSGYLQRLIANLETKDFQERSLFSLIDEEKRLGVVNRQQERWEDSDDD